MRTVGPHVASKFCEIVKLRNRLARNLGYEDFYDYKVRPVYAMQDRSFSPPFLPNVAVLNCRSSPRTFMCPDNNLHSKPLLEVLD